MVKDAFPAETGLGMQTGLPQLEPKLLDRWAKLDLYKLSRKTAKGREKFILHDGPPYANGNLHIGTGLNKILKDAVVRSQQMMGRDANYVPGWDCHGLPIEWKVEEQSARRARTRTAFPSSSSGASAASSRRSGSASRWPSSAASASRATGTIIRHDGL